MFFESMESRSHLAVTASLSAAGELTVVGNDNPNDIVIGYSTDWRNLLVREGAGAGAGGLVQRFAAPAGAVRSIAVYGLGAADLIRVEQFVTLPTGLWGGEGDDVIGGGGGMDGISGEGGNDQLFGGEGNDFLYGGTGNDTLDGGFGQDYMSGMTGIDTVSYAGRSDDLILRASGAWDSGGRTGWNSWEYDCIHHDVESLWAGSGDDYLFANPSRGGAVYAGNGNDRVYGSRFNDRLFGNNGNDTIIGGNGNDLIVGGFGSDYFDARDGELDTVIGGEEWGTGEFDHDVARVDVGWDYTQDIDALVP